MPTRKNQALAAIALTLLAGAVWLAVDLYRSGREEVVRQFNAMQSLLAWQSAHEVYSHLRDCSQDLRALAYLGSVQRQSVAQIETDFQAHYKTKENLRPVSVTLLDTDGRAVFSKPSDARAADYASVELLQWARRKENRGKVHAVPWTRLARSPHTAVPSNSVMLLTPVYRSAAGGTPTWTGTLLMTVELGPILRAHVPEQGRPSPAQRVWLMDQDGTILLQSEHPEMARENIRQMQPRCAECHVSFDYAQEMLVRKHGITEYQLKGHPKKLAAFAPMRFADASWIVVVNAPYAGVTLFAKANFARTVAMVALLAAAVGVAMLMLHGSNLSRVKAEAEAERWREKHRLEEELRRAEERQRTLFEQSPSGILIMDPATTLPIEFNEAAHRKLGFTREEFAELRLCDYEAPGDDAVVKTRLEEIMQQGRAVYEIQHRAKEGEVRTVEVIAKTLDLAESKVLLCIHHDITERKRSELALTRQAEQMRQDAAIKTTLLHDVNHRVKNNLMHLAEMVRLEREQASTSGAGCQSALRDLETRLRGMEVVHSMLASRQWKPLPVAELVSQILSAAVGCPPVRQNVRVTVSAPPKPLWVVPEQATSLALIVNELATNSVKHAFRDRPQGNIEVRITTPHEVNKRAVLRLEYRDDGPGWPEAVLKGENGRLGLHLIRASVQSPLRGDLKLRNDAGAVAELTFRLASLETDPETDEAEEEKNERIDCRR